ncbi:MAG: ATP-binding protein, partial [Proteobacteria bacterium]|nr:ATP-binding protein [Pseudomonadota bacterium]
ERLTRPARFRVRAELANGDYQANRNINKAQLCSLAQGEGLRLYQNLLITGATAWGKTDLACAIGHHHCQQGEIVCYFRLKTLLEKMYLAQAEGRYQKLTTKITSAYPLILDDWGLESLNPQQRGDLLELIEARYDTKSTLIASQ